MRNIAIIGGYGQMGQLFTTLLKSQYNITQIGTNSWEVLENKSYDLVIVCVPINATLDVITKVSSIIDSNTILADFTSIKQLPLNRMLQEHDGAVLALHPMFGPTITSTTNQVIINCGGRDTDKSQWFIDSLVTLGFSINNMTANEHDSSMNFIQGIEHFSTFILGSFLKKHSQHPNNLFNLASPIYQAKLALMGRIFDQDPKLYQDIITADDTRIDLIKEYGQYFNEWVKKLEHKDNQFVDEFKNTAKWMGEFTNKAQLASDDFLTEVTRATDLITKK